jgi:hypothetical protein
MESKKYSRQEFYDLVWSKPMTKLAIDLNISYDQLLRICKANNVPFPKSGYWLKVKFNKKVIKPLLPEQNDGHDLIELKIPEKEKHKNEKLHEINQINTHQKVEPVSIVPKRLSKPDSLITKSLELLNKDKPSTWSHTNGLVSSYNGGLCILVSKSNISRAIRIMDALIKESKSRGHSIKIDKGTFIVIEDEPLQIRLKELMLRKQKQGKYGMENEYYPSGNLSISYVKFYHSRQWSDTKTVPLENKVLTIITYLELQAKEEKEFRIRIAENKRIAEEKRKREQELRQLREAELKQFKSLFSQADRWHRTQYIRSYLEEIEKNAIQTNSLDESKKEWISWAKERADWYDPFINKPYELFDEVDKETLTIKNNRWY